MLFVVPSCRVRRESKIIIKINQRMYSTATAAAASAAAAAVALKRMALTTTASRGSAAAAAATTASSATAGGVSSSAYPRSSTTASSSWALLQQQQQQRYQFQQHERECPQHPRHQQQQPQQQHRRWKHSSTQLKRLFRKHPAKRRVDERRNRGDKEEEVEAGQQQQHQRRQFLPVFEPELLSNGWSAPPPETEAAARSYPFRVSRTENKPRDAVGFLPVYVKYRKDGTKATTRIKRVSGDRDAFLRELRCVLDLPARQPEQHNSNNGIRVRTGGTIEIDGNRVREVKLWLAGLGF